MADKPTDDANPQFAPPACSAEWRKLPSVEGWWWDGRFWEEVCRDVATGELVFHGRCGERLLVRDTVTLGSRWWGPWTPPAMPQNDRTQAQSPRTETTNEGAQ